MQGRESRWIQLPGRWYEPGVKCRHLRREVGADRSGYEHSRLQTEGNERDISGWAPVKPSHGRRMLLRWIVLPVAAIVVSGIGCQCYGPQQFRSKDVTALSTSPRPSQVEAAGKTGERIPVAWVGSFQRTHRQGEFTVLEYKFAVARNLAVVLKSIRRGEPTVVDPGTLEDSEEGFEVWIPNSDNPRRWPEVASPWPLALWTGSAERKGDRTVLHPTALACEIRLKSADK